MMIGPVEKKSSIRIAGYLEKRGKMKLVMCRWKRWWFVLESRLLLYYKSQLEYVNLSPCRGSLNLGLASSVRPGKGLELTIITRSQTVSLRACNRVDHDQWLQSLVDAMALPYSMSTFNSRPVLHYRYASQEQHENIIERIKSFQCPYTAKSNEVSTKPNHADSCGTSTPSVHSLVDCQKQPGKCMLRRVFSDSRALLRRPYKRSSEELSNIALSDTAIPILSQTITTTDSIDKCQSMQELRNSLCAGGGKPVMKKPSIGSERAVHGSKESKLSNSIKIELNLEDLDPINCETVKEQTIGNVKIVLDGCAIYGSTELKKEEINGNTCQFTGKALHTCQANGKALHDCDGYVDKKGVNHQVYSNKDVKSDNDLTVRRRVRGQSLSCENMHTLDRSIGSTYLDASAKIEITGREQRLSNLVLSEDSQSSDKKRNKKRSNSILSRFFMDNEPEAANGTLERRGMIKKRLSFLRKVWKKRERKTEEDYESIDYESIPVVIELPSPEDEKAEDLLLSLERERNGGPDPEPPPDYDISLTEDLEVPPMLPPRQRVRPASPWHDIPKNNKPVLPPEEDHPPPLPLKTRDKKHHHAVIDISQDSNFIEQTCTSLGGDSIFCEPPSRNGEQKLEDLDTLLAQLSEVNTYVVSLIDVSPSLTGNVVQVSAVPEPDYDIPRPHISLLAALRSQNVRSEAFTPTQFLCTTPLVDIDSLDPVINRLDAEMTPDSLECDSPWSLSQEFWSRPTDPTHSDSLQRHFITTEDKPFPDSLNT